MLNKVRCVAGMLGSIAVVLCAAQVQAAPVQEMYGQVAVLHGGIGEDDRAAMQQQSSEYNLRLTFASKGSGAYLSQVRVVIRNAQGATVLDTVTAGPWLFARLPQGEFTVEATDEGRTLSQKIAIKGTSRREWVFRFDPVGAQ
jgi:hypothetical protein